MELYVHIPFCRQKCRYCSFASFPGQESYIPEYIDLLLLEANCRKAELSEPVTTVYIGGGTPSLLPPALLSRLIDGLRSVFDLSRVAEFSSEANPGTVTREWLDSAASLGINRISFGMQAYQDNLLRKLGRIHSFSDVEASVMLSRTSGITNISLDLIFGIPGQTVQDWECTADAALSLSPTHISAYGLIPEEGTPLYRDLQSGVLALPDPDEERLMYSSFLKKSTAAGFHQYEISNFARDGYECLHNIGYWTQIPFIGLGVSAASMSAGRYGETGMSYMRAVNPDTLEAYARMVRNNLPADREFVTPAEARFETIMLGLRMNRGVSEEDFTKKHRLTLEHCYGEKLSEMEKSCLLLHENGFWKMTVRGFDIQNSILVELMDD